ncbi:MAG: hypothetical protein JFR41_01385 [Muribaculaceae bacterium]|nr:hypothetical protein [Muribaculaceae bacterium]
MSKTAKYLMTALVVFLFTVIFGAIAGASSDAGRTPGILGLIAFAGLIGAIRAIWKSKPTENKKDTDSSALQK